MRRMERRARGEETGINLQYLRNLQAKRETWLYSRKHGGKRQQLSTYADINVESIVYMHDAQIPALEDIPVLVLDFSSDSDLYSSKLEKERLLPIIEAFASMVRQQKQYKGQ